MRIAYVISTLEKCGPVNVLYDTAANLGPGFECAVFTLALEPEKSRAADFEEIGVPVRCVVESRMRSMVFGARMLGRALEDWRPDVVHAHGFRATVLAKGAPYPRVATVHNCIYEDFKNGYPAPQARWMEFSEISALRRYDAVVACSESNAAFLRERYGLGCVAVRNGVGQGLYRPATPDERAALRTRLGVSPCNMLLTSSGACCRGKASLSLALAFGESLGSRRGVEYHALGGGPLLEQCRNLDIPSATFHGFTSDVADWLRACDLFVSASRSEGMPMAVLEAASCGLPLLLSDIPPHREVAEALESQDCARLFDARNPAAMREALARAVDEPLARPSDVGCFSAAEMARGYARVYGNLLAGEVI